MSRYRATGNPVKGVFICLKKVDPRPKINVRELVVREHKESLN